MGRWMNPQVMCQLIVIFIILWDGRITPAASAASVNGSKAPSTTGSKRPKIFLFGDSNTEFGFGVGGWASFLANHFSRKADILVRGYAGYPSSWALNGIHNAFPRLRSHGDVAAVTVAFGANDACLPDRGCASRHVPLDDYKKNLKSIVAFLRSQWPSTKIVLITAPPVNEVLRLKNPSQNDTSGLLERTNENAGIYAKACVEVAAECGTGVVNLWEKMQQFPGWEEYLYDGIHFDARGGQVLFNEVAAKLNELGVSPESLPKDSIIAQS